MKTKSFKLSKSQNFRLWVAVFAVASMMSCGGAFRQPGLIDEEQESPFSGYIPPSSGTGDGGTFGSPTSPAVTVPFTIRRTQGASSATPSTTESFNTDSILRVQFSGDNYIHGWINYSSASSSFGCVKYTVQLDGGVKRTTPTIKTAGNFGYIFIGTDGIGPVYIGDSGYCCPDAPTEGEVNFDDYVADRGGAPASIRITNMQYNWKDRPDGSGGLNCPLNSIRPNATFTGEASVITNSTTM